MILKRDAITNLMNRYRAQLPAQESFENKRKLMLAYIARYYDTSRDTKSLITRLNYLKHDAVAEISIFAALGASAISCTVMLFCILHFSPHLSVVGCAVYLLFTAVLTSAAYILLTFVSKHTANADPYCTNDYEIKRIGNLLKQEEDDIALMRLRL